MRVAQVIIISPAGKNRHEHIMESLELSGTQVLPEFKDRDERHKRRRRLASRPGSTR